MARGLRGPIPLFKITIRFGVAQVPQKYLHLPCLSRCIDLDPKVDCIAITNYALLYGY